MTRPQIIVRNLRFVLESGVPKFWNNNQRSVTNFFDNLSIFFPVGERFFIASVRAHLHLINDEKLKQQVQEFIAQEGFHSREHIRYNKLLESQGYPALEMERRVDRLLRAVKKIVPLRWQLGATCALEHLTAVLGHILLENPDLLKGAHPEMAALWRWHAAEENEHRAVAFDVWRAIGGTEPERMLIMVIASIIFWAKVAEHQVRMMNVDGTTFDSEEWYNLYRYLFVEPGGMLELIRYYMHYYRPGFHPLDIECTALVERWKDLSAAQVPLAAE